MRTRRWPALVAFLLLLPLVEVIALAPEASAAPPTPLIRDISMGNIAQNERELSIAVDPSNPNRLMGGANQRNGTQSWYSSVDGGRTWANGPLALGTLTVPSVASPTMSDPSLAYGNDGTLYYSALAHGGTGQAGSLFVVATTDQGANWTDPANGLVAAGTASPVVVQDKEHITVDQANNNVYVAWTPIGGTNNQEVVFSRDLGGNGDGLAFSAPQVLTTATVFDGCLNQGADFAQAGNRLFIAWTSFCSGFAHGDPGSVYVTFSDNDGATWSAPTVAMNIDNVDHTANGFRSRSFPSIDADSSGRAYVVAASNADTTGNLDGDVLLVTSADGITWTAPQTVNTEPSSSDQDEQWMPWVAVGLGRVHVLYYCWDDEGTSINACMASGATGATPTFTESTVSSAPTPTSTGFLGDYNGNFVGSDNVVHPAWGDGRAGVGGSTDAYTARVDFSPPSLVVASGPTQKFWNENATFTATVTGAASEAEQFIPVKFTVTGDGAPSPVTGTGTTNAAGQVGFTFTNPSPGVNNVHVWADLDENGVENVGESTDRSIKFAKHPTATTYGGPATGVYSDPVSVTGTLIDSFTTTPIGGQPLTIAVGSDSCSAVTNGSGVATCSITLTQVPGPYSVSTTFAGSAAYDASADIDAFVIQKETTVLSYTGPTLIANNLPIVLRAALNEDDGPPVTGRSVALVLGTGAQAQTCAGVTNATGVASCTIASVNQPLGAAPVSAVFSGDAYYLPSAVTTSVIVFQWTDGGSFVLGDQNAGIGAKPVFWSSTWYLANPLSGGPAPSSFKGFSNKPAGPTACGGTWKSLGGNSNPPPTTVPQYTAMLVTSSVNKKGETVTGSKPSIVIVRVDPGYRPNPGHPATAEVVAVLCS